MSLSFALSWRRNTWPAECFLPSNIVIKMHRFVLFSHEGTFTRLRFNLLICATLQALATTLVATYKHGAAIVSSRVPDEPQSGNQQPDIPFPAGGPRVRVSRAAGSTRVCDAHRYLVRMCSHSLPFNAGSGRFGRRPRRLCLCDQSSTNGYESHLHRRTRQTRRYLSQHRVHPFEGNRLMSVCGAPLQLCL